MEKYVHYGSTKFDLERFQEVKNQQAQMKPSGGFWASTMDDKTGLRSWKPWYKDGVDEIDEDKKMVFTLTENAKVLQINSTRDLSRISDMCRIIQIPVGPKYYIDFERLAEQYDVLDVNISKDNGLFYALHGWEHDAVLIMNPDVIVEIEQELNYNNQKADVPDYNEVLSDFLDGKPLTDSFAEEDINNDEVECDILDDPR